MMLFSLALIISPLFTFFVTKGIDLRRKILPNLILCVYMRWRIAVITCTILMCNTRMIVF